MKDLLEKLRWQHAEMIALLAKTSDSVGGLRSDCSSIASCLGEFRKIFVDHLYLENKFLYPVLLEKENATKFGILNTEIFLSEIAAIQEKTIRFLNKYDSESEIGKDYDAFKGALAETANFLKTRIQLEEEGLFKVLQ